MTASIFALFTSLLYFIHFSFKSTSLRLAYLVFLILYPLGIVVFNLVVANSMKNVVLKDQDELALNAEFLDFEDTEQDILRKAVVRTVIQRIRLQRIFFIPLYLSGWYKLLGLADFSN